MKSEEVKAMDRQTSSIEAATREMKNMTRAIHSLNTNVVEALAALRPEKEEVQDAGCV